MKYMYIAKLTIENDFEVFVIYANIFIQYCSIVVNLQ